jgi:hypothetical protein
MEYKIDNLAPNLINLSKFLESRMPRWKRWIIETLFEFLRLISLRPVYPMFRRTHWSWTGHLRWTGTHRHKGYTTLKVTNWRWIKNMTKFLITNKKYIPTSDFNMQIDSSDSKNTNKRTVHTQCIAMRTKIRGTV